MTRLTRALGAVLAAAVLAPAAAQANDTQISIFQDDDLLVYRDDQTRDAALQTMKGLGADAVRVTILWSSIAEGANDKQATKAQRKRFKDLGAANPKAYLRDKWDRYDRLAKACRTLRIICYFNVTGPGPAYGHAKPPKRYAKDAAWWKPKNKEFYKFVQAVGKRYSGSYKDENDGRLTIPKVGMWSIWNEPNQGAWLRPQWEGNKPVSPQLYRGLWDHGYRALVSTGHAGDAIFVGETAPRAVSRKTTTSAMGARTFINEFFCVGQNQSGCSYWNKGALKATAWAHHFYTRDDSPLVPDPNPDVLSISNYNAFTGLLDEIAGRTQRLPVGLNILNSEFGYESNPPDPFNGVSLELQSTYNQIGELLSFLNPRVIGHAQFLLRDSAPNKRYKAGTRNYYGTYQSGLYNSNGRVAKPAQKGFTFPFLATPTGPNELGQPTASIWGQTKFRPDGAKDTVQILWRPADGSADYTPAGEPIPIENAKGFFTASRAFAGPGQAIAAFLGPDGSVQSVSNPQTVG